MKMLGWESHEKKSICVFTGSELSNNQLCEQAVVHLGLEMASKGINLIYGGGRNGLMGVLADTVLNNGGTVTGVITDFLYEREGHNQLTKMLIVKTMQERKVAMADLAHGFIALPGGLGTFEELLEVWNAAKLRIHDKPIGLLNIDNFYSGLLDLVGRAVNEGLAKKENQSLIQVCDNPGNLLNKLINEPEKIKAEQNAIFASG